MAAGIQGQLLPLHKNSNQPLTRTHRSRCIGDGWHIARWAAHLGTITDSKVPVLNAAQAVHVHCPTGEGTRIVQSLGVACFLYSRQSIDFQERLRQRDGAKRQTPKQA